MRFFDLHCDTIFKVVKNGGSIYENDFHVSLKKTGGMSAYVGVFAVWIDDSLRGQNAFDFFEKCARVLSQQAGIYKNCAEVCKSASQLESCVQSGKRAIIPAVEGSAALGGDISRVKLMSDFGVKIMTLTWNGPCEVGDGAWVLENPRGLTNFGKKLINELERYGIIVDVSHASEKLFYDVLEVAGRPVIATHSNAKEVCRHARNLSKAQIESLVRAGGIIGLTFCKDFLSLSGEAGFEDVLKHVDFFLSLSCEGALAIGSDFDGCSVAKGLGGIENVEDLYEFFLKKNYKEELLDKIFFKNAYEFVKASYQTPKGE